MGAKRRKPTHRRRLTSVSPIPPGFRSVTPYLSVDGAAAALDFYKRALGAKEVARETTANGRVVHARMRIGDSMVMLSDVSPGANSTAPTRLGTTTVVIHLYSKDLDRLWQHAVAAGMHVVMPLEDRYWGERYGQLVDPFGHRWALAMRIRMSSTEKEEKREVAMAESEARDPAVPGDGPRHP